MSTAALQPELGLDPVPIDPTCEKALRIVHARQPWRRKHPFEKALKSRALYLLLRNLAEIAAKKLKALS